MLEPIPGGYSATRRYDTAFQLAGGIEQSVGRRHESFAFRAHACRRRRDRRQGRERIRGQKGYVGQLHLAQTRVNQGAFNSVNQFWGCAESQASTTRSRALVNPTYNERHSSWSACCSARSPRRPWTARVSKGIPLLACPKGQGQKRTRRLLNGFLLSNGRSRFAGSTTMFHTRGRGSVARPVPRTTGHSNPFARE